MNLRHNFNRIIYSVKEIPLCGGEYRPKGFVAAVVGPFMLVLLLSSDSRSLNCKCLVALYH